MTNTTVRRSGRIPREIPILLIGSDAEGTVFSEETKTVMISLHGAGIVSTHTLVSEQELNLRLLESNRETEIRVVGEIGSQNRIHAYGVAFVDPTLDFWQIPFPPAPANEPVQPPFSLSCTSCDTNISLQYGDFEADVCAIHGGLVRYCRDCGLSTMWKRCTRLSSGSAASIAKPKPLRIATAVALLDQSPVEPALQPLAELPVIPSLVISGPAVNRRDRIRAKVNFFACIRTDAFGDDIVHCIDMSRGGLSFKTEYRYQAGAVLRIAVPYSPESREAPAIFVPAKVVYTKEIPLQEMFRCGVAYLPNR
jgi:hypothetical protein